MGEKNKVKRDIFISYRREGGDDLARMLYLELSMRGYSVFYDLETLENGKFNEALYWYIGQCTDFLLILPPNSLDRCQNQDDWVRLEIAHALKHKKNIIPVMLPDFQAPKKEQLPADIRDFLDYNGVNCARDKSYYTDMVDRIVEKYLDSQPSGAVFGTDGAPFILQKPDADCTIILKDHFRCPKCGARRIYREDRLDKRLTKIQPWIDEKNRKEIGFIFLAIIIVFSLMILVTTKESMEINAAVFSTVPVIGDFLSITLTENMKWNLWVKLFLLLLPFAGVYALIVTTLEHIFRKRFNNELREGPHTVQGICENCNTKFLVVSEEKQRDDWTPPDEEE